MKSAVFQVSSASFLIFSSTDVATVCLRLSQRLVSGVDSAVVTTAAALSAFRNMQNLYVCVCEKCKCSSDLTYE